MGLLSLVVVSVAACGGEGAPQPVEGGSALELPVADTSGDDRDAEIVGVVVFEEATGCVVLERDEYVYPVLWPEGTNAQRDPFLLTLPGGEVVHEGDTVVGGGGFPSDVSRERAEELGIPFTCIDAPGRTPWNEVAVFDSDDIAVRPASD
jgi:hypothetical protein